MQRPVLLVIDMLNDYLDKWDEPERSRLVGATNELVQIMRRAPRPVIWVRQEFEPDLSDAFPEMSARGIHVVSLKCMKDKIATLVTNHEIETIGIGST
jgi:nicotinamidase-related amidase